MPALTQSGSSRERVINWLREPALGKYVFRDPGLVEPSGMDQTLSKRIRIERWFVRRALGTAISLTRLFPLRAVGRLSRIMADLAYYVLSRNRKLALQNLSLAYGRQKSPTEIREMAREVFRFGSRSAFELLVYHGRGNISEAWEMVKETEGLDHLEGALRKGKGAIGLCAHLGNFIILGLVLNSLGYRCATIMRQMRDEQLEEMFTDIRQKMRQTVIPKFPVSRAVRGSLRWLAQGNILAMYMDQRSESGVIVDFLGLPTSTAEGAALFALRSKAPVLPMFVLRRDDGFFRLLIGPEVEVVETGNLNRDTFTNTARFAEVVASYVRQYPTQWFWFDRRWRRFHKSGR